MPDIASQTEINELKRALQTIADSVAAKCRSEISDAALGLITAINYKDQTLVDSSLTRLTAVVAELADECIARELDISEAMKRGLREGWQQYIDKKAYEIAVYEEIKDKIESMIDERIACLLKLRKFVERLREVDQQVETAHRLEDGIRGLRRFREEFLKNWPSRKPPSPINQAEIAKAREAIRSGQKGMSKDELIWGSMRSSDK